MQGPTLVTARTSAAPAQNTRYLWGIALAAALGGLLFGYDWVVIGGAREFYELYFGLTSASLVGWANSCALVGCLVGSVAAGYLAERFGRKPVLLISAVLFAVSSALTGLANTFSIFVFWRIAGGIAIGLASNVSPLYIAEISPATSRGRLVSLNQFAVVVGILLAQIINWCIARPVNQRLSASELLSSWNVQTGWRWMFAAVTVPAAIFAVTSFFIPESPRWLLGRGRASEAGSVLSRIGGDRYADAEVANIVASLRDERKEEPPSWRELLHVPVRRIVLIGVALAVLQQWTGINILFNYASEVYRNAGYGTNDIFLNIVITGSINLVFTVLAMQLVDRLGRRWLMLLGCAGIGVSHILCALAYGAHWKGTAVLVLTLSAIACYALTLAPVTWVLISEIFPNRVRSQAISVAVSALWIASFVLTYTFPLLNEKLGSGGLFGSYGAICIIGGFFVYLFVPETKDRSLEDITASFTRNRA